MAHKGVGRVGDVGNLSIADFSKHKPPNKVFLNLASYYDLLNFLCVGQNIDMKTAVDLYDVFQILHMYWVEKWEKYTVPQHRHIVCHTTMT